VSPRKTLSDPGIRRRASRTRWPSSARPSSMPRAVRVRTPSPGSRASTSAS